MLPDLETALYQLRADRLSGASALTLAACAGLRRVCERYAGQDLRGDLEEFALGLVRLQPNMGSIWNLANSVLHRSSDIGSIASLCDSLSAHYSQASARIAERAVHEVSGKRVLTISSSSAVFHTLMHASGHGRASAIVCESRPMREGVMMARELGQAGVDVTVIADASLMLMSSRAQVGLAGADAVTKDGVIAKTGLAHLSAACDARNMPLIVLADSSKFAPIVLSDDPRDPGEILEQSYPNVRAENRYFEHVGFDHISAVYSEKGRLSPHDAQREVWGSNPHPRLVATGQ